MMNNILKVSVVTLILGMASGCETQGDAMSIAQAAARDAADAKAAAASAQAAADSAQSTADRALSAATDAQACCDANRDRLERMFQRSQAK